jgi:hypothetical protein
MKFMRITAGYSLLDRTLDKMEATPVTEYVNNYRQNRLQHVKIMSIARIQKHIFRYAPLDDDCQED